MARTLRVSTWKTSTRMKDITLEKAIPAPFHELQRDEWMHWEERVMRGWRVRLGFSWMSEDHT